MSNSNSQVLNQNARLIGFQICPFVARARVVALEKNIHLPVEYISLSPKPEWFLDRSPTGTVPALEFGDHFIFESSVISEFLDEISEGSLHPETEAERALNRSWIEYASSIIRDQYMYLMTPNKRAKEPLFESLFGRLARLEAVIDNSPFFNGEKFMIIDAAYAPVMHRFNFILERTNVDVLTRFPKLSAWSKEILARPSIRKIFDPNHEQALIVHLNMS